MRRTSRGFGIYSEFKDSYGSKIRVVKSSNAMLNAVWIFCKKADEDVDWSPHLTVGQAKRLIKALQKFVDGDE